VKYLEWYCHKSIGKAGRYQLENSNLPIRPKNLGCRVLASNSFSQGSLLARGKSTGSRRTTALVLRVLQPWPCWGEMRTDGPRGSMQMGVHSMRSRESNGCRSRHLPRA
jgi:hypothetical protein